MTTKKTAKQKAPLEKDLNKQIIAWLDIIPGVIWFERINSGKIQTAWGTWIKLAKKGTPDFIALVHGGEIAHVLFIECKRKGEIRKDGKSNRIEQRFFEEKVSGISNVHYLLTDDLISVVNKINDISHFQ